MLQDVTRGACSKRFCGDLDIHVHGQEHDFGMYTDLPQPPDRINAIQRGHRDIRDNHVRLQPSRGLQQRPAVTYRSYEFEIGLQQPAESINNDGMIVSQQQRGLSKISFRGHFFAPSR